MWDSVDQQKRWQRSLKDMDYEILLVSQFTLYSKFKVCDKRSTNTLGKQTRLSQVCTIYTTNF
jgi:D-Tyr-tRNAtyr deacylase